MCGIVGHWNFKGPDLSDEVVDTYVDTLAHRGPGSRGVWRNKQAQVSLGHRRLAIFDLSDRGAQPMPYADKRYWITFNGEIFNFHELQEELGKLGYAFQSTCDTEVILAAYQEWGEDCLYKFNGSFAFALWDENDQTFFCARDHYGMKPFHYISGDDYFAYASEMKAFLALPRFKVEFDEELVAETITNVNGLEGTEYCLLKGVKRLPAGWCMRVSKNNIKKWQWWKSIEQMPIDIPKTEPEQVERFRELLFDSCRLRLISDLPIVATLSGGLDSSSVTSVTASILHAQGTPSHFKKAYVASFPGTNQEETNYAKSVAEFHNIALTTRIIDLDENMEKMIDDIIWHTEDIYWVLPAGLWKVHKNISQGKKESGIVALDGSGGDEVAIGHYFIIYDAMQEALIKGDLSRFRELQQVLMSMRGGSVDHIPDSAGFIARRGIINSEFFQKHVLPALSRFTYIPPWSFLKIVPRSQKLFSLYQFKKPKRFSAMQHSQYVWTHYTGMQTVDRVYDRVPAANSVSLRAPLLDYRLVSYSLALSDKMKVGHGYAKYILREAVKGLMPEEVRLRTNKIGFTSPMDHWFAGPLQGWLLKTIEDKDFLNSNIWDGFAVREYVKKCIDNQEWSKISTLWPIFNAHHTMRLFHEGGIKV
ncbi:MAG TPA: asparagine synthase (glutamine-hydrolyzing) [Candidatus Andersenbacteria bacterium]|nr:asparagine synthase (glutamine-hydrolyzing) [Candidatus Andersenbacteria bacterium]